MRLAEAPREPRFEHVFTDTPRIRIDTAAAPESPGAGNHVTRIPMRHHGIEQPHTHLTLAARTL